MNDYYASPSDLAPGTKARASDINTIDQSVDAAFDRLPAELALKTGTVNYAVNKSAAPNAYAVDLPAAVKAYSDGLEVKLRPGTDNTGACTLNVNGLGNIAIKRQDGTDAQAGDLVGAAVLALTYVAGANCFRMPPLANAQVTQAAASAQASATSAAASAASAGQASGSAQAAATARGAADQSATAAGQSAGAAAQSASAANTSAGQASGSAQAAATSAANLASAVTSASQSAGTATTKAQAASDSAGAAATSAGQAQGSATAANTSATNAATSASAAATSAALAQNVANGAQSVRDTLLAIAQQLHAGVVADVFLYDTSRDSDGGAWRKRCKATSWENEPLAPGKWLGQQNGTVAAIAAGGVPGDYFQYPGDATFYLIGSNGSTVIYRGNSREFPALALIVVEAFRVVIYDATQPGLPMWMVFVAKSGAFGTPGTEMLGRNLMNRNCAVMCNGDLWVGTPNAAESLIRISFIGDVSRGHVQSYQYFWPGNIAQRNLALPFPYGVDTSLQVITNPQVNRLAIRVLSGAPVDPLTGLPAPTLAVATQAGVDIFKHDGTTVRWMNTFGIASSVSLDAQGRVFWTGGGGVAYRCAFRNSIPASGADNTYDGMYAADTVPQRPGLNTGADADIGWIYRHTPLKDPGSWALAGKTTSPLQIYKANPTTPLKSMVAYITAAYSTGWLVGDVRGAWLADTVAEVIGSEILADGSFNNGVAGWTRGDVPAWVNGQLEITSSYPYVQTYLDVATVPGKTYRFTGQGYRKQASGSINLTIDGIIDGTSSTPAALADLAPVTFVAQTALTRISVRATGATAGDKFAFDNLSLKLADADRSVKGKALTVNGTVTKAPVAVGAQMVAYSGFSAANYLEQPYNSDLDFGTGDFCIMGWGSAGGVVTNLYNRADPAGSATNRLLVQWATSLTIYGGTGSYAMVLDAQNAIPSAGMCFVAVVRRSGVLEAWVNGTLIKTAAFTQDISNSAATLRIGGAHTGVGMGVGSLALVRASATAPSADQIAQIYRDELALFQPGAQATIDGTSTPVTALAYDDTTDVLHIGTSWGRSAFKGLQRIESSASIVGAITALAAGRGTHITGGATGARFVQPSMTLRDELLRKDEARRAMALVEIPIDFDGIAAQTTFTLPFGFATKGVFVAGTKKRNGPTKDYTVTFDGYRESVVFGVSPGATWVQITANRSI